MFMNPPTSIDLLGLSVPVVVGIAIVGSVIGMAWIWRITRGPDDGDDHWRYRR